MGFSYFTQASKNKSRKQRRIREKQLTMDIPKSAPAVFRQRQLTDDSPFPFGKWKGTMMKNVPAQYLDWMIGQDWAQKWPAVIDYINRSRKAIDQDLKHDDLI